MPDHVHLLVPAGASEQTWKRILGQHGRLFGTEWTSHTQPATTSKIVWRTIGYVVCNPLRSNLVDDPWIWPWSSLRDLGGIIVEPWTIEPVEQLARHLRVPKMRVLADLTDDRGGHAPLPARVDPDAPPIASLPSVAAAVASSLRVQPDDVRRRGPARTLFVHAAAACGPVSPDALAEACDVTPRAIYKLLQHAPPRGLRPALRCLQDPRLRIHDVDAHVLTPTARKHLASVRL